MATFNVRGMYKYISLPHIMQVWLDGINMNISFSKIELIITKINSSLRKYFVKYTLIQYHFRMANMYLCPFSTPINEEILKKID